MNGTDGKVHYPMRLAYLIDEMRRDGSSLILNYGEDTDCWEVSWVAGGVRFTAVNSDLTIAADDCRKSGLLYYGRLEDRGGEG